MSTIAGEWKASPYSLMRIGEAWRNGPGLRTLLVSFVTFAILVALGGTSGSGALLGLTALLGFVVLLMGGTAAGMQFMEQAAGRPVSGTARALSNSPMVLLRSLGLGLAIGIVVLAFMLLAALLLLLCKIPGLGPVLYIGVLPILALTAGLGYLITLVAVLLAAPALWEGHSLKASLAQLWAVVTQRPVEAFLQIVVLWIVSSVVAAVIVMFVSFGFMMALGMSAAILPGNGGFGGLAGLSDFHLFSVAGLMVSGGIGAGIVFAVVAALVMAVLYLGLALVYLKLTSGIDFAGAAAAMDSAISRTRERAQQAAEEARRRASEAQAAAQQRFTQARPAADAIGHAHAAAACPACHATVTPMDVFCGNCGQRLR